MTDLISRDAAVKALGERPMVWGDVNEYELGRQNQFDEDYTAIMNVPRSDDVLLAELIKMEERRNYWEEMALSYERTLAKLQKAIPEERHGKWVVNHRVLKIGMPFLSEEITIIKCSECGATTTGKYNYCPNCGATMDKGDVE